MKKLLAAMFVALLASVTLKPAASGADADFPEIIQPFLKEHCIKCHGPKKKKGKLVLHTIKDDFGSEAGSERWIEILNQLTFGEMPPPDEEARPESSNTAEVVEWIQKRLIETGESRRLPKEVARPRIWQPREPRETVFGRNHNPTLLSVPSLAGKPGDLQGEKLSRAQSLYLRHRREGNP